MRDSAGFYLDDFYLVKTTPDPLSFSVMQTANLHDFGQIDLFSTVHTSINIVNRGLRSGRIDSVGFAIGTDEFLLGQTDSITLAPNDSVAFDLSFTPQADSIYTDTLIIWCSGNQDSVLQVALTGRGIPNGVGGDKRDAYPTRFEITDTHPNPFNSETTIEFTLPQSGWTTMGVVDVNGRVVSELARGQASAGRHSMVWKAEGVPAGIYLVRLQAGGEAVTRKVVLLK